MENPRSPLLSWPFYYQGKSMEDLRQSLLYTTLELESTRLAAQEEITNREHEISHLQELLNKTIKERDEAQDKCRNLLLEQILTQQKTPQKPTISSIEDELPTPTVKKDTFSSSDCEESIVSSPQISPEIALQVLSTRKPLPEKGKLLDAVMNSGPLLQTLLLAGPLPEWQHPPPPLETSEIPPVRIPVVSSGVEFMVNGSNCGVSANRKRNYHNYVGVFDGHSSETNKYQRVLFP